MGAAASLDKQSLSEEQQKELLLHMQEQYV